MRPLPEEIQDKPKVSLTEKIARVGVWVLVSPVFVALFIYGFVECDKAFQPYNDVIRDIERKAAP